MKSKTDCRAYHQGARAEAAEATGRRIVEAFLARVRKQWFEEITLDQVAEDAGVTVQTVVRRFGGKPGLLAEGMKVMGAQINARRAAAPDDVDALVENLVADYERTGETVIRLLASEARHPELKEFLDFGRSEHRRWTAEAFAKRLSQLDAAKGKETLDALVVAGDVYTWNLLRCDMGRSVSATRRTMKFLFRSIIENSARPD